MLFSSQTQWTCSVSQTNMYSCSCCCSHWFCCFSPVISISLILWHCNKSIICILSFIIMYKSDSVHVLTWLNFWTFVYLTDNESANLLCYPRPCCCHICIQIESERRPLGQLEVKLINTHAVSEAYSVHYITTIWHDWWRCS